MIEIAAITDTDVARLRPEWEALWRRDPAATPFQSPAWLLPWLRFFASDKPVMLTARARCDGGCRRPLVGLLPLYLLAEADRCKLLPIGIGVSDYIDALVDPAAPEAVDRLLAAIAEIPGWDECWLPDLPRDGSLARAHPPDGLLDRSVAALPCPVLALPADPAILVETLPPSIRRDLRQGCARGTAAGDLTLESIGELQIDAAMDDLFRLHGQRWQARGEDGVCRDQLVQGFYRASAHSLSSAGMLRLYRLSLDDRAIAVHYGLAAKGRAYYYLGGFDPTQSRLSPGKQILSYAIEKAIAERAAHFDFLRGGEPYKYAWGAIDRGKVSRRLTRR